MTEAHTRTVEFSFSPGTDPVATFDRICGYLQNALASSMTTLITEPVTATAVDQGVARGSGATAQSPSGAAPAAPADQASDALAAARQILDSLGASKSSSTTVQVDETIIQSTVTGPDGDSTTTVHSSGDDPAALTEARERIHQLLSDMDKPMVQAAMRVARTSATGRTAADAVGALRSSGHTPGSLSGSMRLTSPQANVDDLGSVSLSLPLSSGVMRLDIASESAIVARSLEAAVQKAGKKAGVTVSKGQGSATPSGPVVGSSRGVPTPHDFAAPPPTTASLGQAGATYPGLVTEPPTRTARNLMLLSVIVTAIAALAVVGWLYFGG